MTDNGQVSAEGDRSLRIAVYPGTFDPPHLGHIDVARRAARIFDRVIVAVSVDPGYKNPLFTGEERVALAREALHDVPNLVVESYPDLTVDYARRCGAIALVRGVRTIADFESEIQQAHMNSTLVPTIESVFFMTRPNYLFFSSSLIKQVALRGGDVSRMVSSGVDQALREKRAARV